MRLPRGVTGFNGGPGVTAAEFKAACYAVARLLHGRVEAIDAEPHPGRNYHTATLALRAGSLIVLCNAVHPLIAFQRWVQPGDPPTAADWTPFIDEPEVAATYAAIGSFNAVPSSALNRPPDDDALVDLNDDEREQMHYWNPQTLGDIVYNHWD